MAVCSHSPDSKYGAALPRHSQHAVIVDETNSRARFSCGVARKSHVHNQLRVPPPTPRPDPTASGKFNSATTLLRYSEVCPRLQRLTRRLGFANTTSLANQSNFPDAVASPQLCALVALSSFVLQNALVPCPRFLLSKMKRKGRGSGWCPRDESGSGGGVNAKIRDQEPKDSEELRVGRSTVEFTRAKKNCPGRGEEMWISKEVL